MINLIDVGFYRVLPSFTEFYRVLTSPLWWPPCCCWWWWCCRWFRSSFLLYIIRNFSVEVASKWNDRYCAAALTKRRRGVGRRLIRRWRAVRCGPRRSVSAPPPTTRFVGFRFWFGFGFGFRFWFGFGFGFRFWFGFGFGFRFWFRFWQRRSRRSVGRGWKLGKITELWGHRWRHRTNLCRKLDGAFE